jgi:hypothetical protein
VHVPGEADLNVYSYVGGAVLRAIDPMGLQTDAPGGGGELRPGPGKTVWNPPLRAYGQQPAKIGPEPPPRTAPTPAGAAPSSPTDVFDPVADLSARNPSFGLGDTGPTPGQGNSLMQNATAAIGLLTGSGPNDVKLNGGGSPGGIPGGQCEGDGCVSGGGVQAAWAAVVLFGARAGEFFGKIGNTIGRLAGKGAGIIGEAAESVGTKAGRFFKSLFSSDAATGASKVNMGQQGKHILGHNNYKQGRSVLKADPNELAKRAGTGTPANNVARGAPGFRERVDFGEVIGDFVQDGVATPTTNGIIHYGKDGIHIVPAAPKR